jgi:hypothetical protein
MIQSDYNGFGLTWQEVVSFFPKMIESDFSTFNQCGSYNIERQIENFESEIVEHLTGTQKSLLNELPFHSTETSSISGDLEFVFRFKPIETTIKAIKTKEINKDCCYDNSLLPVIITETDDKWFGNILQTTLSCNEKIFISYKIDFANGAVIRSLKEKLKQLVCCYFGQALHSMDWGLVEWVCDRSKEPIIAPELDSVVKSYGFTGNWLRRY